MKKNYALFADFWRQTLRRQAGLALLAFLLLALCGYVSGIRNPKLGEWFLSLYGELFDLSAVDESSGAEMAVFLFYNNAYAAIGAVLSGLIPFLYLPALSLCVNGFMLGVFGALYVQNGLSLTTYLSGIVPHGIFEIPALAIAWGAGLYVCSTVSGRICHRDGCDKLSTAMGNSLRSILCVCFPMLLIAALVEAFLTPLIMLG